MTCRAEQVRSLETASTIRARSSRCGKREGGKGEREEGRDLELALCPGVRYVGFAFLAVLVPDTLPTWVVHIVHKPVDERRLLGVTAGLRVLTVVPVPVARDRPRKAKTHAVVLGRGVRR